MKGWYLSGERRRCHQGQRQFLMAGYDMIVFSVHRNELGHVGGGKMGGVGLKGGAKL